MLDDDDLLWVDREWVALTQAQAPVVRLLLEHLDQVVPFGELQAAYESVGGSGHPASMRTVLTGVATRVR